MSEQDQRNIFSINNKHQMQIIFLITAPLFVISVVLLTGSYLMNAQVSKMILNHNYLMVAPCISKWFFAIVCFTILSLLTFLLFSFKVAYDMVNPFSRIVLEVDEILITGDKRIIAVRPEDELAKDVADRFNKLISQLPLK